ncbi:DNA repair protein RAD51 homolog 4 isoform X3 [Quercus robur]|uniref:DNA repair protein RAD51 homolog 4 isoform X3 n=1 Tax=Quercus robur TaxID=38942 RepID=UPI0021618CE9|nr:DNA repair protein RAD51 homolog 4 isoform X3 [Quercus robur]
MAPLKSLEQDYPILDSNFHSFCASHDIFSVEDLLLHDLYLLAAFAEQESSSERLKQGITQVLSIIDGQHQPWLNGMELLEDAQRNKHVLSTGCEGIDLLLHGGLRVGQLTELVGPSSSGKTQAKHRTLQKVMNNISCKSVFDIFTMFDVLHQLEFNLRSQMQGGDCKVQLLIVDSVSSMVTPILGGSGSQGIHSWHALMISAGYLLKKLAHEHNIAVLVTNHTVGGDGGISKPALGESWKSIPHVRLLLSRDHGGSICNVSILKHPSMVESFASLFTMCAIDLPLSLSVFSLSITPCLLHMVFLFLFTLFNFFFPQAVGKAARFMIHN